MTVTKFDNKTRVFKTGAKRGSNKGKGRFDLIPYKPLKRLALVYQYGAEHYGERNWEKGIDKWSCIDSAIRHIFQDNDGIKGEDHLAKAVWNLFAAMFVEEKENKQ